jgi:hypothetical protein
VISLLLILIERGRSNCWYTTFVTSTMDHSTMDMNMDMDMDMGACKVSVCISIGTEAENPNG